MSSAMAEIMTQWLTFRTSLVDWKTARQTESGGPARLEEQPSGDAAHPLFFGGKIRPNGLLPVGGELFIGSQSFAQDEEFRLGVLVDEFGNPVMTEWGASITP